MKLSLELGTFSFINLVKYIFGVKLLYDNI